MNVHFKRKHSSLVNLISSKLDRLKGWFKVNPVVPNVIIATIRHYKELVTSTEEVETGVFKIEYEPADSVEEIISFKAGREPPLILRRPKETRDLVEFNQDLLATALTILFSEYNVEEFNAGFDFLVKDEKSVLSFSLPSSNRGLEDLWIDEFTVEGSLDEIMSEVEKASRVIETLNNITRDWFRRAEHTQITTPALALKYIAERLGVKDNIKLKVERFDQRLITAEITLPGNRVFNLRYAEYSWYYCKTPEEAFAVGLEYECKENKDCQREVLDEISEILELLKNEKTLKKLGNPVIKITGENEVGITINGDKFEVSSSNFLIGDYGLEVKLEKGFSPKEVLVALNNLKELWRMFWPKRDVEQVKGIFEKTFELLKEHGEELSNGKVWKLPQVVFEEIEITSKETVSVNLYETEKLKKSIEFSPSAPEFFWEVANAGVEAGAEFVLVKRNTARSSYALLPFGEIEIDTHEWKAKLTNATADAEGKHREMFTKIMNVLPFKWDESDLELFEFPDVRITYEGREIEFTPVSLERWVKGGDSTTVTGKIIIDGNEYTLVIKTGSWKTRSIEVGLTRELYYEALISRSDKVRDIEIRIPEKDVRVNFKDYSFISIPIVIEHVKVM